MADIKSLNVQLKKNVPATNNLNVQLEQSIPNYAAERILTSGMKAIDRISQEADKAKVLSIKSKLAKIQNDFAKTYLSDPTNFSIPEKRDTMFTEYDKIVDTSKGMITESGLGDNKKEELFYFLEQKIGSTSFTMTEKDINAQLDRARSDSLMRQGELKLLTEGAFNETEFNENLALELDNVDYMVDAGLIDPTKGTELKLQTIDKRELSFLKRKLGDIITDPGLTLEQKTEAVDNTAKTFTSPEWLDQRAKLYQDIYNAPKSEAEAYAKSTRDRYIQEANGMNNELKSQLRQQKAFEEQQAISRENYALQTYDRNKSAVDSSLQVKDIAKSASIVTGTDVSTVEIFQGKEIPGTEIEYTEFLYGIKTAGLLGDNYTVDLIPIGILNDLNKEATQLEDKQNGQEYIYANVYLNYIDQASNGDPNTKEMMLRELRHKGFINDLAMKKYKAGDQDGYRQTLKYVDNAKRYDKYVSNLNLAEPRFALPDATKEKLRKLTPNEFRTFNEQLIGYIVETGREPVDGVMSTSYVANKYDLDLDIREFVDNKIEEIKGTENLKKLRPDVNNLNEALKVTSGNQTKRFLDREKTQEEAGATEPETKKITVNKGKKVSKPDVITEKDFILNF